MLPARFILFISLFFTALSGLLLAEELPLIEKADGTAVVGNPVRVDGSVVVVQQEDNQLENLPLADLTEESRIAVLQWALPKILGNDKAFPVEFYRKIPSSDEASGTGGFEVNLFNRSMMDLPEDLQLEFVVHYLDFETFWGMDESAEFRMVDSRSVTEDVPFGGLNSGDQQSYEIDSVPFPEADRAKSWSHVLAGADPESDSADSLTKAFLEVRMLLGENPVGSFTESPTASAILANETPEDTGTSETAAAPLLKPSAIEAPLGALVIITGTHSTGSGFLAEIRGRRFLVTNAHVVAGAGALTCRTVEGETLTLPNYCFLSDDRDLALIPVQEGEGEYLQVMENIGKATQIGDPITVFGNEAGALVATELRGRVRGIGPQQVEIDAKIIEGNSGSPVIADATNQVVGVVAYYIEYEIPEADRIQDEGEESDEASTEEESEDSILVRRRFAERIDNAEAWSKVTFSSLDREQEAFDEYRELVIGIAQIASEISRNKRIPRAGFESDELENLTRKFHQKFDAGNRRGSSENRRAFEALRYQMFALMDAREKITNNRLRTSYFRKEFDRLNSFAQKVREYLDNVYTT